MDLDLLQLKETVQKNCHIADAQAAGDYTLCIYLLKMREFYRWESGYNYGDPIPGEEVGNWLREREQLWETLNEQDFESLVIGGQQFDPFEAPSINESLVPERLVYSGGLGRNSNPHFFLGVLQRKEQHKDFDIFVVADEYARDLTAPPAMSQGKTIYLRREALRRMLWEKYEQWVWNKPKNALGRALAYYQFDSDVDKALETMTNNEINAALLHEVGEVMAHHELGQAWEELLIQLPHSKLELMLRAVRDHFADALSTLPELLAQDNEASLHFYIGNLNNMRKDLFPSLVQAYDQWLDSGNTRQLHQTIERAQQHWGELCHDLLQLANQRPEDFQQPMLELIENNRL